MKDEEQSTLVEYLTQEQFSYQGLNRYSTINAGLRESRIFTKRDKYTGKYNPDSEFGYPGHWLGAIGYFTILDQLGSCFKEVEQDTPAKYNKIKFAIETFGFDLIDNDNRKLHAFVALRNAFTHDFNLLNIPERESKYELERCKFTVYADPNNDKRIVELPSTPWNGDIVGKDFLRRDDTTFINLFAFGSLVEAINTRIVEKVKANAIETTLSIPELINKYTFVTSDHVIKNSH